MSTKTSIQRITEAEARRAQDHANSIKHAQQKLKLVDRFIRKLMDHPITVKGYSSRVVRDRISVWNDRHTNAPFDQPVWSLGFYQQHTGTIKYDANISLGIMEKRSNCDAHIVSEADVLVGITKLLLAYGVPAETLEQAELDARREWGDQALAKVKAQQEESKTQETIVSLGIAVGAHPQFKQLCELAGELHGTSRDIERWVGDLAIAADQQLSEDWEHSRRDFICDMDNLADHAIRLSLDARELVPAYKSLKALISQGYETYGYLLHQLQEHKDCYNQRALIELEGKLYPLSQVCVIHKRLRIVAGAEEVPDEQ